MARTESANAMDDLQSELRPSLKEHGFRMRARTCNRTTPDGLIHVINFQMGRYAPLARATFHGFEKTYMANSP
jgi:hypothetical protein